MNEQEKIWFEALTKDRAESAHTFEKPSMRGAKDGVVEKYSDQAHFVYELLQNADDAGATLARFTLDQERLVFSHNGSRHFTLTDPAKEGEGAVGDINAITSIGNSSKKGETNKIGKFGVGFKAVFQYTTEPHIYDRDFRFKIERFFVPVLLENDFPKRNPEDTLFVFPFNHPERNATEAHDDISEKLRNLSFPLLFLSHLKRIDLEFSETVGRYEKRIEQTRHFDNVTAELVCLTQNYGGEDEKKRLWLFSRTGRNEPSLPRELAVHPDIQIPRADGDEVTCSVGFFLDEQEELTPVANLPAFCFFPTKESTGLNFIIHAPFLSTDSREGIHAGNQHNRDMVENLARLAADAIFYLKKIGEEASQRLIDDSILDIIPYDPGKFSDIDNRSQISFLPFYNSIHELFKQGEIIPTRDGYTTAANAYWASVQKLTDLFSDQQLGAICENEDAHWVFTSLGREATGRKLREYIDSLVQTFVDEDAIIKGRTGGQFYDLTRGALRSHKKVKGITPQFIEAQDFSWLHEFYAWLHESKPRTDAARNKPIFLNQKGEVVSAVDETEQPTLFLPSKEMDENVGDYNFIHPSLLENEKTRNFIQSVGIKEPSLWGYIYNIVLPQYRDNDGKDMDRDRHFKLFFKLYCEGTKQEADDLIRNIKNCAFLTYYDENKQQTCHDTASKLYLPTPELQKWFETKPDTRFLDFDKYLKIAGKEKEEQLRSFFLNLGANDEVVLVTVPIDRHSSQREDLPNPYSTRHTEWEEDILDGCQEIVEHIAITQDKKKSFLVWENLLRIFSQKYYIKPIIGKCKYFYYHDNVQYFASSNEVLLKQSAWLVNSDGEFVSPSQLTRQSLAGEYDTQTDAASKLLDFLDVAEGEYPEADRLTDEERKLIERGKSISDDEWQEFQEYKKRKQQKNTQDGKGIKPNDAPDPEEDRNDDAELNEIVQGGTEDEDAPEDGGDALPGIQRRLPRKLNDGETSAIRRIVRRVKEMPQNAEATSSIEEVEDDDADQDVYTPRAVDYKQRIRRAEDKSAADIHKIVRLDELQKRAQEANDYSYAWFKALLEMECLNSEEQNGSKEISIIFAKVEREPDAQRTLVLKHPSRNIPPAVEELDDFPLVLHMANGEEKKLMVEAASVKSSYTLHVKLKSASDIAKIDCSSVRETAINIQSPAFLTKALRDQFEALGLEDSFDMQANLCENIEFVFGPPGTGKTTHLAKNVLLPLMQNGANCKALVLAPTNKAADVLAHRIMEEAGDVDSYRQWLVRFGTTPDEKSGLASVYKDRAFNIHGQRRSVVVTTMARFAYDGFTQSARQPYLRNIEWDYIVIDEASMIPIANIIYPLYKQKPQKFIIAGDPFQIEPIASADLWKDENIYKMVGLNTADSFKNPQTKPYDYKVERLETQYRSIPEIGQVFSEFAYNGILQHNRPSASQKPLNLGDGCGIKALNIIKFPVSRYESIYRAKRLQRSSSYQIYAALFTYEYVLHLAREIAAHNPESSFTMGVIAPYRAQADLIDKLLASAQLPKGIQVQAGTIHGFQGDECDIVFAVFNTPPTITSSNDMFLNKRNIINVAISRARDYLFIVMPDDETKGIGNLEQVKRVESLAKDTDACAEFAASDLEMLMFGDEKYLEHNTFSTSHQSVNVYGLPDMRYEVRAEDSAVDIQIHHQAQQMRST